nr:hypothetical protein [Pandoravirus aubagnensis]
MYCHPKRETHETWADNPYMPAGCGGINSGGILDETRDVQVSSRESLRLASLLGPDQQRIRQGNGPFDLAAAAECLCLLEEAFVIALHDDIVADIVGCAASALGTHDFDASVCAYSRLTIECDRHALAQPCTPHHTAACPLCACPPSVAAIGRALDRLDALDRGLGARASLVDARTQAMQRALASPDGAVAAVDAYRGYLYAVYATLCARYMSFWALVTRQPLLRRASVRRTPPHYVTCASASQERTWGGAYILTPRDLALDLSDMGHDKVGRLLMIQQQMTPVYDVGPPLTLMPFPGAQPTCRRWAALPDAEIVARAVDIHERRLLDNV